ncbi:MAG: isochorismatase family cysteine hydrolase [Desulfobacteraceae bacterium]|jgi:nicotinamidase-related amidase
MVEKRTGMRPALLVIDMVRDNFDASRGLPITPLAREIIGPINQLSRAFRAHGWPVVFATDAFHRDDFIFTGRMRPHSLAGSPGAEVVDDLERGDEDLWLPKPRFSAFFRTDLDRRLRGRGVTLCAVAGIATNFCVLTTALDAICFDFQAVLVEDASAAVSREIHEQTLVLYHRSALFPLLRVLNAQALLAELEG